MAFCHWASRRSIWYCLAGNRLSLADWWDDKLADRQCLVRIHAFYWSEPRHTRGWLSSEVTPASKGNPSSPCNHSVWLSKSTFWSTCLCVLFQDIHTVICRGSFREQVDLFHTDDWFALSAGSFKKQSDPVDLFSDKDTEIFIWHLNEKWIQDNVQVIQWILW